ncbi:dihydrodipicolinate synthase family protein [Marispirochaeta aestuarii]|uniref:Dihydrodipicolinate synthase family protein n=1 Tax=Marispirochaeta aestuarii TaxID=1963862 RepID=A0A1Y1S2D8_9SPIO|nr:dihydrodipicolinate synthase family protein [Marispirochaeta aestuarii]ORC37955.1 dihydrodipicolinate synthase family protein [Marispirochaeta aestuarii]
MSISTFVALVTAFREDESVNFEKIRDEARRQIAAGNDIFACGTNGDFSSLTFDEKVKVVESCAAVTQGKNRLIANAGCPSTHETILLAREFARIGVEAVAAITPYFISCTQEGLYRHYSRIADSLPVPVFIYEIPARTGNSIDVDTVARLAKHPNVKGVKDSSGKKERLDALAQVVAENPGFELYAGTDSLILYGLRKGASGCVSGLANVIPSWIRNVADSFESGDAEAADAAQERVNRFREALYAPGYPPAMVKRILYLLDREVGNNRLPSLVPSTEVDAALNEVIDNFGLERAWHA